MTIQRFEDILAWQTAKVLVKNIYFSFQNCKDIAFKSQIQRAALSIMNNIAEGYERQSNKDFSKFLYIAKGSSGEVRSMLYMAREIGYISNKEFDVLYRESEEISKMISGFIKTLQT
jgi:four helix bundle protein